MKKNNNKNKNKKKRTPAPPWNVRPNSFVPRALKGTHAGEGSLASTKCHCLRMHKNKMPTAMHRYRQSKSNKLETVAANAAATSSLSNPVMV